MRFTRSRRTVTGTALGLALALALALATAGAARAAIVVVPPRPGQVGLSVTGAYSLLPNAGEFGKGFDSGPGLAVRLRYRMRYERGFGLTFEGHGFDPRPGQASFFDVPTQTELSYTKLNLYLYGVDFYQMFGTRTKTTRMLNVGAGIMHPTRSFSNGDVDSPGGDGLYASAGAGLERFFWQSWAWDLGARYYAIFHDGKTDHDLQGYFGLIFYASL